MDADLSQYEKMKRDSTLGKLIRITLQKELKKQQQDMSIKQDLDVADGKGGMGTCGQFRIF